MRYEYRIVRGSFVGDVEAKLNELGQQGWKVVAASFDPSADEHIVYLMREGR